MAIVAHERGRTCPKCGFGNSQRSNKCVVCGHGLSKFRNKKVKADGFVFGSEKEYERYKKLVMAAKEGLIRELCVHPTFEFKVNGITVCTYESDFCYKTLLGLVNLTVEDVKSKATRTPLYRVKKKLMKAIHGIDVREV
jgi:ribosomal protein L37E